MNLLTVGVQLTIESYKDFSVRVRQFRLSSSLGNGRRVNNIVQCGIWKNIVWWLDGSANYGLVVGRI